MHVFKHRFCHYTMPTDWQLHRIDGAEVSWADFDIQSSSENE